MELEHHFIARKQQVLQKSTRMTTLLSGIFQKKKFISTKEWIGFILAYDPTEL